MEQINEHLGNISPFSPMLHFLERINTPTARKKIEYKLSLATTQGVACTLFNVYTRAMYISQHLSIATSPTLSRVKRLPLITFAFPPCFTFHPTICF